MINLGWWMWPDIDRSLFRGVGERESNEAEGETSVRGHQWRSVNEIAALDTGVRNFSTGWGCYAGGVNPCWFPAPLYGPTQRRSLDSKQLLRAKLLN
jgi:hypothetical protein